MCSPESLHYFCLWDRRHTRNWKIVFQVRSVWYSTSSSYLCQASSLRGKITQDWLFGLKWDLNSLLVWQEVSWDILPSIFTSLEGDSHRSWSLVADRNWTKCYNKSYKKWQKVKLSVQILTPLDVVTSFRGCWRLWLKVLTQSLVYQTSIALHTDNCTCHTTHCTLFTQHTT